MSKMKPDDRINILRIIQMSANPLASDAVAYSLGMAGRTVRRHLLTMFNAGDLQRARVGNGWTYFVSESAKKTALAEGFAGTAPQSAMPTAAGAAGAAA